MAILNGKLLNYRVYAWKTICETVNPPWKMLVHMCKPVSFFPSEFRVYILNLSLSQAAGVGMCNRKKNAIVHRGNRV